MRVMVMVTLSLWTSPEYNCQLLDISLGSCNVVVIGSILTFSENTLVYMTTMHVYNYYTVEPLRPEEIGNTLQVPTSNYHANTYTTTSLQIPLKCFCSYYLHTWNEALQKPKQRPAHYLVIMAKIMQ